MEAIAACSRPKARMKLSERFNRRYQPATIGEAAPVAVESTRPAAGPSTTSATTVNRRLSNCRGGLLAPAASAVLPPNRQMQAIPATWRIDRWNGMDNTFRLVRWCYGTPTSR